MHRTEVLVFRTDTYHLLSHLDGIGIFRVQTGDESISLASLYHHHTEVVAFEHLVVSLLERVTVTLTLLGEDTCIALTAFLLAGMTEVDNVNTLHVQVERVGQFLNGLLITQQDRLTDSLGLGLYGSLQHGGVYSLGKYHALRMSSGCGIELLGELGFLT